MSNDIALRVENLCKHYRLGEKQELYKTLRDTLTNAVVGQFRSKRSNKNNGNDKFWALKDVSFEVKRGEVVGIIGNNGAGKSTLLKILSRITEPTSGYADVYGRVGSLLEVGTGFQNELTGRENTYLNGSILGMKRAEIARKFDEIVDFAEVEKFIDTPVKHYSTGMYLRLAFAVAAHLDPEILLVDEVLAVGDVAFQKKCLGKMGEVAQQGRTVLFVSHNIGAIGRLCSRVILLKEGAVVANGPSEQIVTSYLKDALAGAPLTPSLGNGSADSSEGFRVTRAALVDSSGSPVQIIKTGQELRLEIGYEAKLAESISSAMLLVTFTDENGNPVFVCNSRQSSPDDISLPAVGTLSLLLPRLPLLPGRYLLGFRCKSGKTLLADCQNFIVLEIADGDFFGTGRLPNSRSGSVLVEHEWRVVAQRNLESPVSSDFGRPQPAASLGRSV